MLQRRNKTGRTEVHPTERGEMLGMRKAGASIRDIATETGRAPSTVHDTLMKAPTRVHHASAPRSAPRKTTNRQDRLLRRLAINSGGERRRQPLAELHENVMPDVSRRTVQRRLKDDLIKKWKAKGRPELLPEHMKKRMELVQYFDAWGDDDFAKIVWTDEMSVSKQDGAENVWVFRRPGEGFLQECIEPQPTGSRTAQMFWGCICFGAECPGYLTSLQPDKERTGKNGITGILILEQGLQECLPDLMDGHPERRLMQDNARPHTIPEIKTWLEEKGYQLIVWPPYSPDLNPIEFIWGKLSV